MERDNSVTSGSQPNFSTTCLSIYALCSWQYTAIPTPSHHPCLGTIPWVHGQRWLAAGPVWCMTALKNCPSSTNDHRQPFPPPRQPGRWSVGERRRARARRLKEAWAGGRRNPLTARPSPTPWHCWWRYSSWGSSRYGAPCPHGAFHTLPLRHRWLQQPLHLPRELVGTRSRDGRTAGRGGGRMRSKTLSFL